MIQEENDHKRDRLLDEPITNDQTRLLNPSSSEKKSEMTIDELRGLEEEEYFILEEQQVVPVEKCTYGLDAKEKRANICSCSGEEFTPICDACIAICHKESPEHKNHYSIKGVYDCGCGKAKHKCSDKNPKRAPKCFYSNFFENIEHNGFFIDNDTEKIYCSLCCQNIECVTDEIKKRLVPHKLIGGKAILCNCDKHQESNIINLANSFINAVKEGKYLQMKNFNTNLLPKIKEYQSFTNQTISFTINEYCQTKSHSQGNKQIESEKNFKFFNEYNLYNILKAISVTKYLINNPNLCISVEDLFKNEITNENSSENVALDYRRKMLDILKMTPEREFEKNSLIAYFDCKFLFAELIYNLFFNNFLVLNNVKVMNLESILNMNVAQRYIYLNQGKNFYNFNLTLNDNLEKKQKEAEDLYKDITVFIDHCRNTFDKLLQYKDKFTLDEIKHSMNIYHKIMKNLIKYNFLKPYQITEYFNQIQGTFKIQKKVKDEKSDGISSLIGEDYIIKSIFYTLLQNNDKEVIKNIARLKSFIQKKSNKINFDGVASKYAFMSSPENNLLSNVFLIIVNSRRTFETEPRRQRNLLKFDLYVTKILDLMASNSHFYIKNILNLKFSDENVIEILSKLTEGEIEKNEIPNLQLKIRNSLNKVFFDKISEFSQELTNFNRQYFHYSLTYYDYMQKVNNLMKSFKDFMNKELVSIPLHKKYNSIRDNQLGESEDKIKNLRDIRSAVKYTNFFQALNGFIHIYAEDKVFQGYDTIFKDDERSNEYQFKDSNLTIKDMMTSLLYFLFSFFREDPLNICLLFTLKPRNFILAFKECESYFFYFLEHVMDALFGKMINEYQFDNTHFYISLISELISFIDFGYLEKQKEKIITEGDQNNYQRNLVKIFRLMAKVFKFCRKPLKHLSFFKTRLIDIIETLVHKMGIFKSKNHTILKEEVNHFLGLEDCLYKETKVKIFEDEEFLKEKEGSIENFLKNYFQFMNELYSTDLRFFEMISEDDCIIDLNTLNQILSGDETNSKKLPVLLELSMREFYHKNLFNFNLKIKQVINLYPVNLNNESSHNYFTSDKNYGTDSGSFKCPKNENNSLNAKADYLISIMARFNDEEESMFERILKTTLSIKSLIKRRILLLGYFENCYVRPIYNLVNQYIFKDSSLKGEETYKIYLLIFYFLNSTYKFYTFLIQTDIIRDNLEDIILFESMDLYQLENLYVVFKINRDYLENELKSDIESLSSTIRYFEIDLILEKFRNNLKKILICDELIIAKNLAEQKNEEAQDHVAENEDQAYTLLNLEKSDKPAEPKFYIDLGKYLINKSVKPEKIKKREIKRVKQINLSEVSRVVSEELLSEYVKCMNKCNKSNRSLIKEISTSQNELFDNMGYSLVLYLVKKMTSSLTYAEVYKAIYLQVSSMEKSSKKLIFYRKNQLIVEEKIAYGEFSNFKTQHLYIITILNNLFYHDYQTMQKIFYKFIVNNDQTGIYDTFENTRDLSNVPPKSLHELIKIFAVYNIHSCLVYECSKVYKIERLCNSNMLAFQLVQESTKFLQNLCEGHNYFFQNLLYNLNLCTQGAKLEGLNGITANFPFINFIIENISLLITHSHFNKNSLYYNNRLFKSFTPLQTLFKNSGDLIIELIQGANKDNMEHFFFTGVKDTSSLTTKAKDKTTFGKNIVSKILSVEIDEPENKKSTFGDMEYLMKEVKMLFKEDENVFQRDTVKIKKTLFAFLINMVTDDEKLENKKYHEIMMKIFPPEELIKIITFYWKVLHTVHVKKIKEYEDGFIDEIIFLQIDDNKYKTMVSLYKNYSSKLAEDPYFKLAISMQLFISIMGDKKDNESAFKIKKYGDKIIKDDLSKQDTTSIKALPNEFYNKVYTSRFFNHLIRQCEFVIRRNQDNYYSDGYILENFSCKNEEKKKELLTNVSIVSNLNEKVAVIYFVCDPRNYLLSDNNIDKFFDDVDRTTSTTKLKSFTEEINLFFTEVMYKHDNPKKLENNARMLKLNYLHLDILNFIISLFINFVLVIRFKDETFFSEWLYYFILCLSCGLILINIIHLVCFFISKYEYIIVIEKARLASMKTPTWQDRLTRWTKIYIFKSVFNEEIYLIYINILIPLICIFSKNAFLLFPLQLFTVLKFSPTVKEIVLAFSSKFNHLIAMVGFLTILIIFYANLGFFFMHSEFNLNLEDGTAINVCSSLLECFATYFNFGVRSGGGIGDVIGSQPYRETYWYFLRFFLDMIFYISVILLIMNMINGIIISTFGALREENEKKEEDKKEICLICSLSKITFEKHKVNFQHHVSNEHNFQNYIKYFIILKLTDERDLNAEQSYINNCLNQSDIGFFPVMKSKSLEHIKDYNAQEEEDE